MSTATTIERRERLKPHEAKEFSTWHEECMEYLMQQTGASVTREPNIGGKTPDLLVTPAEGEPFVIECIARLQDEHHAHHVMSGEPHYCEGNVRELHRNIYSRVDHKATKYRGLAEKQPYVIALFDGSCMNGLEVAVDLMLAPYAPVTERTETGKKAGKHYNTLWCTPHIPAALFELYPHVSGFIYSRWPKEHHYLPNPHADRPVPARHFPFASVPDLSKGYQEIGGNVSEASEPDDFRPPPTIWLPQIDRMAELMRLAETA